MNRLREIRKAEGMTQLKLSALTGITQYELSRIENGWVFPWPGWRKRIAKALNVAENEVFPEVVNEQRKDNA
jgi:transcriptional regulator with XRE-family HTH domain